MKDQNTIPDGESKRDKWKLLKKEWTILVFDIFIESVIEPDPAKIIFIPLDLCAQITHPEMLS